MSCARPSATPSPSASTRSCFVEKFTRLRDDLGVSSIMVGAVGELDPVVKRLAGT